MGKSALAVLVAERVGGAAEIVGADAFQVYAGLDRLIAKPSAEARARVPHHLVGVVPPEESFSVARYLELAHPCLADIARRGRTALVVGGTGLYVRALTDGLSPLPPARPERRAELAGLDAATLFDHLRALDPTGAATVDRHNPRRLVRAIEIVETTGRPLAEHRTAAWFRREDDIVPPEAAAVAPSPSPLHGVFLNCSRPELHARIARRTAAMFDRDRGSDGSVLEEVRALPPERVGPTLAQALGLADLRAVLRGELPVDVCRERLAAGTRQYAKRQITWFKRERRFQPWPLESLTPAALSAAADAIAAQVRRTADQRG